MAVHGKPYRLRGKITYGPYGALAFCTHNLEPDRKRTPGGKKYVYKMFAGWDLLTFNCMYAIKSCGWKMQRYCRAHRKQNGTPKERKPLTFAIEPTSCRKRVINNMSGG